MIFVLAFYAVALLVILGAAAGVYRLFARRSRLLAAALALLALMSLVLLWPMPIHGGFSFLGGTLYEELQRAWARRGEQQTRRDHAEFAARVEARFAGTLELTVLERLSARWSRVRTPEGIAWYDSDSYLVLSDWQALESDAPLPTLDRAKARCRDLAPAGHWALISEPEGYLLWRGGGRNPLPKAPASTVSYLVDESLGLELPTYGLRRGAGNADPAAPSRFVVRCVARTAKAPPGGYVRMAIPLEEWNRYQLSKGSG